MSERLGLRRLVGRHRRGEHYETEDERYDDLRDADGMIDLTGYGDTATRQHEAFCYIDLAPALLDQEHLEHLEQFDEGDWPAA